MLGLVGEMVLEKTRFGRKRWRQTQPSFCSVSVAEKKTLGPNFFTQFSAPEAQPIKRDPLSLDNKTFTAVI